MFVRTSEPRGQAGADSLANLNVHVCFLNCREDLFSSPALTQMKQRIRLRKGDLAEHRFAGGERGEGMVTMTSSSKLVPTHHYILRTKTGKVIAVHLEHIRCVFTLREDIPENDGLHDA